MEICSLRHEAYFPSPELLVNGGKRVQGDCMTGRNRSFRGISEDSKENTAPSTGDGITRSLNSKQNSKELLLVTGAAVNALSSLEDCSGDGRNASAKVWHSPASESKNGGRISRNTEQNVVSMEMDAKNKPKVDSSTSRADTSCSSLDQSFRGTQRVKIPARLLREIKAPSDRSWSASRSLESSNAVPGTQLQGTTTPVVVRHTNGPSAWVSTEAVDESSGKIHSGAPNPINVAHPAEGEMTQKLQTAPQGAETRPSSIQTTIMHQFCGTKVSGQPNGNIEMNGLLQGEPTSGGQLFVSGGNNEDEVTAKCFTLNDKEKSLKENFGKRADQRGAVRRIVQPRLVTSHPAGEPAHQGTVTQDPVATAAAIAAAAASAATGPFLQIQHSLESQIGALVSNLQMMQQQQQEKQNEQDKQVQQQVINRLDRLEEMHREQTKIHQAATMTTAQMPANSEQTTRPYPITNQPYGHVITSSPNGGHVTKALPTAHVTRDLANGVATVQYSRASQFRPVGPEHDVSRGKGVAPGARYPMAVPDAVANHKTVKNTTTQTSPQDSLSSQDSPLQTPLPRKRPPVPISRYEPARPRNKGPRYEAGTRARRVHFDEPEAGPRLPVYRDRMTDKGHRLLRELLDAHEEPVRDRAVSDVRIPLPRLQERPKSSDPHENYFGHVSKRDITPLKSEAVSIVNDLGQVKEELQQVLKVAEKLKTDMDVQKVAFPPRPQDPSPLDAYLMTDAKVSAPVPPAADVLVQAPVVQHCADAERILQDVQRRRKNLETNLQTIQRQRAQEDLYVLVDSIAGTSGTTDDTLRIRRGVDSKIREITAAVKREIQNERSEPEKDVANPKLAQQKTKPGGKPGTGRGKGNGVAKANPVPGSSRNAKNSKKTISGKENVPRRAPERRIKPREPRAAQKPSPRISAAQQETYASSVYGRPAHYPQRLTSKAPYLHYQSPVNPRTTAVTAGILKSGNKVSQKPQEAAHQAPQDFTREHETKMPGTRFYFHPITDAALGEGSGVYPVQGQLVPMAVPLGKPKMDPRLRLPIATETTGRTEGPIEPLDNPASESTHDAPACVEENRNPDRAGERNVAIFHIRDTELEEKEGKTRKKARKEKKRPAWLGIQVLPTVDIDSFSDSSVSVETPRQPRVADLPDPVSRPDDFEYQEFRNYLAVRDTETGTDEKRNDQSDDESNDFARIPTPENPLTLQGHEGVEEERPYNGAPFPPQHPPLPSNVPWGAWEADTRREETIQQRAMDWVEQELLARIVSEMNQPVPDPTLPARRTEATPDSSVVPDDGATEDADMLAATIGLGGVQLFVDAGLPVDRELVGDLIREVLAEKVVTTLGWPRPATSPRSTQSPPEAKESASRTPSPRETPLPTPLPTPEYTPPMSEDNESASSPVVATPQRTPTASVSSEGEATPTSTGEERVTLEPRKEDEPVVEENDRSLSEVAHVETPAATPDTTPPGAHTPASDVLTPEPSVREPEESVQGSGLPTPQPSVSTKTPTPPPEPSTLTEPSKTEEKPPSVAADPRVLTPPSTAPAPQTQSPSTATISTMSSSTLTTDGELSVGELIQPYVHAGMFSEGEYAVSPAMAKMAAERNLPVGREKWDASLLGRDDDSRNDLIHAALTGILRREPGATEDQESNSSIDTMRDTEDLREDSISQSEGEVRLVRPRDPMGELLSRIQRHMASGGTQAHDSDGEVPGRMREPFVTKSRAFNREDLASGPPPPSPGEVRPKFKTTVNHPHSPGELSAADRTPGELSVAELAPSPHQQQPVSSTQEISTRSSSPSFDREGPPSRSLHASDLFPNDPDRIPEMSEHDGIGLSRLSSVQELSQSQSDGFETKDDEQGVESVNSRFSNRRALPSNDDGGVPSDSGDGMGKSPRIARAFHGKESEPKAATRIQVMMPSIDLQESSVASDIEHDIEVDETIDDVSSISGGDF